jgi:PBSX family phage terminase large subunit
MKKSINITPARARAILEARQKLLHPIELSSLFSDNFPQQKNFVLDNAKLKAIFCTRRAAKSFTAGLYMVYEALSTPNCNVLFIGLTRQSAKDIIWKDILQVINRQHKLNCKFNKAELSMTFTNGSKIQITGVDTDAEEMNKLLGRKYRLVCIDEASMYTVDLRHLVYDILSPAMADLAGTICLMGTSSNYTRGLFYDITNGIEPGWSLHQWSAYDNPFVARQWQDKLNEIAELRPLYMETPQFKQWYLNKWVVETDKLVYKYNQEKNLYIELPKNINKLGWRYVLGIDLGYEDDTAFVLTAYHENDPHFYVIDCYNEKHMSLDQVADKIKKYMNNTDREPSKIVIDGAAKQSVESMRIRYSIPFEYTDKQGKSDFIEILNADLIQAKIKISSKCNTLVDELMSLVWKTDGDKIVIPRKEHPALPNHLCDAFLYAWRMGYHYHAEPAAKTIVVGSKEWYQQQSEEIWDKERERLEKLEGIKNGDWPDDSGGWSKF